MISQNELKLLLKANIQTALDDYWTHTNMGVDDIYNKISPKFINRLAEDAIHAKADLRDMLRKSSAWDEELQAVIINGTKTHDTNYDKVRDLACRIMKLYSFKMNNEIDEDVYHALRFFLKPTVKMKDDERESYIKAIEKFAPNAYHKGRKRSRIFMALCQALGIADMSAGSEFQRLFAQFADELSSKKIDFKLYLSINPAHFMTMSNPKRDTRGEMLTSCHSLNSNEYDYNNGCSGYARDDVTMIAFTVDDPNIAETLNNRKTSRQLFMYKVDNGVLLQSRLYDTTGGTRGTHAYTALYRDLVQREISSCEDAINLWKTFDYCENYERLHLELCKDRYFGGYDDWIYSEFKPKLSIRQDHIDDRQPFEIGASGLCLSCGDAISEKLFCNDCGGLETCYHCDSSHDSSDMYEVYSDGGERVFVCEDCYYEYYETCYHCGQAYHRNNMTVTADGYYVCDDCLENHDYQQCAECGSWFEQDSMYCVYDANGNEAVVCENCCDGYYDRCEHCEELCHVETMNYINDERVCDDCYRNYYEECKNCGKVYKKDELENGLCVNCRDEEE